MSTAFICGADFAQSAGRKADDGALVILAARLRPEVVYSQATQRMTGEAEMSAAEVRQFHVSPVYGRRYRGIGARDYAGLLHGLQQRFGLALICMDPGAGGGGLEVQRQLRGTTQLINGVETAVVPIVSPTDPDAPAVCLPNLVLFSRGDPAVKQLWQGPAGMALSGDEMLVHAAHQTFRDAWERRELLLPPLAEDLEKAEYTALTTGQRESLAVIGSAIKQLGQITVITNADGTLVTARGVPRFRSQGRKDLAMALLYAWTGLLVWLRRLSEDAEYGEGEELFSVSVHGSAGVPGP